MSSLKEIRFLQEKALKSDKGWITTALLWVFLFPAVFFFAAKHGAGALPLSLLMTVYGIGILLIGILMKYLPRRFYKAYKAAIAKEAAAGLFDEFTYLQKTGFDPEVLKETGLMNLYGKRFYSDDYYEGIYQDIRFARADIEVRGKLGGWVKGKFIGNWNVFTFPEKIPGDLWITTYKPCNEGRDLHEYFRYRDEDSVLLTTENATFDEIFLCSCKNKEDAFSILTPQLMRKLLGFYEKTGYPFAVAWIDNRLHVIVEDKKDTVHPGRQMDGNPLKEIERAKNDLRFVCDIVDEIIMGNRIFSEFALMGNAIEEQTDPILGEGLRRQ